MVSLGCGLGFRGFGSLRTLNVQVPNNHILAQNLCYNHYNPTNPSTQFLDTWTLNPIFPYIPLHIPLIQGTQLLGTWSTLNPKPYWVLGPPGEERLIHDQTWLIRILADGLGFRVRGFGFRVQGLIQGLGFRVGSGSVGLRRPRLQVDQKP